MFKLCIFLSWNYGRYFDKLSFEFKYFLLLLFLEYNMKMTQHIYLYCPSLT